jgi:ribosomal protein L7/L12
MKIRIVLTQSELKSIVARHLNLPNGLNVNDLTVTISAESEPNHWDTLQHWNEIGLNEPRRKIEAIKAVRTAYPGTSLADAKYAMEKPWNVVNDYVTERGSLFGFAVRMGY